LSIAAAGRADAALSYGRALANTKLNGSRSRAEIYRIPAGDHDFPQSASPAFAPKRRPFAASRTLGQQHICEEGDRT